MDHTAPLIDFPADESGRRSSTAFGRAVVADALRQVDPAAAAAAEREADRRRGYPRRFRAFAAAHGGLWRTAYTPRTALPLAAVRGLLPR